MNLAGDSEVKDKDMLKKIKEVLTRKKDAKKGDYGKVAVVGGSEEYTGGIVLTAEYAYSLGVDIVTLISPSDTKIIALTRSPWLIAHSYSISYFDETLAQDVCEKIKNHGTLIIGPGMGSKSTTSAFIYRLLSNIKTPKRVVMDADALTLFSFLTPAQIKKITSMKDVIITPHRGEFKKYFNLSPSLDNVKKISRVYNITVLLKASEDIVVKDKKNYINKHGTPLMAKAGTGDALAGVVGAFFEITKDSFKAAKYGVFLFTLWGEKEKLWIHTPYLPTYNKFKEWS